jgi:aminoglycoside/choline kinase family phosphotransferase
MDPRQSQLQTWLRDACGLERFAVTPASGDASFRRYFRVGLADGTTRIAMDAPPSHEDCGPYLHVGAELAAIGLHVPAVEVAAPDLGFLLLEDLGETLYLDVLDEASADRLYGDALSALVALQACGPRAGLPPYDAALLQREMELFRDWLAGRLLGLPLDAADHARLDRTFALLTENALGQPRVCVHRDYHSRNLMVSSPPTPGILDFQDAVVGPVTYDLVSLLKDCYVRWPQHRVDGWAMGYFELAVQSGVLDSALEGRFLRWLDLMGAQRHLKAAGIFARLWLRDGKPGYLKDIPRTLGYIVEAAGRRPELADLAALVEDRVLPAMAAHLASPGAAGAA